MKISHPGACSAAALALVIAVALAAPCAHAADAAPAASTANARVQDTFATPEEAAKALADAMRSDERKQIWRVLGPGASKLIRSGDPVQDEDARQAFVAAYDKAVKFEHSGDTKATLIVGPDDFPFPYPLVMRNGRWQFDAKQGDEEVLNRRIGRNELSAINVCLAYVDAQREYAAQDRSGNGLLEYAQKLSSSPGKHDGLFWETKEGEPPSPLGPLAASARSQGYGLPSPGAPYHGYYYKILTGQGKDAPGGAYDYVVHSKMIGGFGLVAYPARWGASGVMTFLCNHDGVVYEKNLGSDTQAIASKMTLFNPDSTWSQSKDQ
ncbi:conserved exported hypothetical protein [Burkholderiales bacterium]|nr:conserved exported hypothetical protein [Burkholderiales bacterium]